MELPDLRRPRGERLRELAGRDGLIVAVDLFACTYDVAVQHRGAEIVAEAVVITRDVADPAVWRLLDQGVSARAGEVGTRVEHEEMPAWPNDPGGLGEEPV